MTLNILYDQDLKTYFQVQAKNVLKYFQRLGTDQMDLEIEEGILHLLQIGIPPWYFRTDIRMTQIQLHSDLRLEVLALKLEKLHQLSFQEIENDLKKMDYHTLDEAGDLYDYLIKYPRSWISERTEYLHHLWEKDLIRQYRNYMKDIDDSFQPIDQNIPDEKDVGNN